MITDPVPVVERSADDLAALMFTSGTAGSPKAAASQLNAISEYRNMTGAPLRTGAASCASGERSVTMRTAP